MSKFADGSSGIIDVVSSNLEKPQSIAVSPNKYFLFWTDIGDQPKIVRSGLDGSSKQVILMESIIWPTGIAIDRVKERLYWLDVRLHSITSCDFDGSR